jgi:hypothetical protein
MSSRPTLPTTLRQSHVVIETTAGQRITLDDASHSILIQDSAGNLIRLDPSGVTVTAAASVTINASQVTVNAAMSRFTGTIQTETLIANSVIASSYTPGAGNLW